MNGSGLMMGLKNLRNCRVHRNLVALIVTYNCLMPFEVRLGGLGGRDMVASGL